VAPDAVAARRAKSTRPPHADLAELMTLWQSVGLANIVTDTLELAMAFSSFNDYWEPFLEGSTPTSAFAARLDAQTRSALRREMRKTIPGLQPDGSFVLPARAWAISGKTRDDG
jgi:hypothetical protein